MDGPFGTMRRLYDRGPGARGLVVDRDGVMPGPGCVLDHREAEGYRCARTEVLALLKSRVFAGDTRLERLPIVLDAIARALDQGDLVRAPALEQRHARPGGRDGGLGEQRCRGARGRPGRGKG